MWTYLADVDRQGELTDFTISYNENDLPVRAHYQSDLFGEMIYPKNAVSCPRFAAEDVSNAYTLAFVENTTQPALRCRVMEDHTSIVSILPALPEGLLSDCILWSDAHLYSRTGDVVYAGGLFVGMHARTAGEKRLYLPQAVKAVVDLDTGEEMLMHDNIHMDFEMKEYETRMFQIIP